MNGADAAVRCLAAEGVEYVFGYPGVAICPFYDSILDTDIKTILVRQEQNAAHEASGYARMTGKPGVVAVTSGPGAENLITGIATAYADSIPMVCITGQVDSALMGSDGFQEADVSGACESFVKYSYIVRNVEDVPRIFKEAFHIANTGRKGPVLIDFPYDVQKEAITKFAYPETVNMRTYKPTVHGNVAQIRKVIKELNTAKKPVICVGGGVQLSNAEALVRAFAEKHSIPVVCTMMGLSSMPTKHPLFFGMVGNNGRQVGNRAINDADLVIVAGARVADRSINRPAVISDSEHKTLVHIDVDPAEIGKNAGPSIPLVGDLAVILEDFAQEEEKEPISGDYSAWVRELSALRAAEEAGRVFPDGQDGTVDPRNFIRDLSLSMEDDSVYVADVGQNQLWSCANFVVRDNHFFTSGGMGTMGYSIGAAIGAKVADPSRQVVAVCGDGSFQMSMMELGTARQYDIPLKVVVMQNGWLGLVRQHQHLVYKDRFSVTDLFGSPDLSKIAEAYGMKFLRLSDENSKEAVISEFLEKDVSVLLEVDVNPNVLA